MVKDIEEIKMNPGEFSVQRSNENTCSIGRRSGYRGGYQQGFWTRSFQKVHSHTWWKSRFAGVFKKIVANGSNEINKDNPVSLILTSEHKGVESNKVANKLAKKEINTPFIELEPKHYSEEKSKDIDENLILIQL